MHSEKRLNTYRNKDDLYQRLGTYWVKNKCNTIDVSVVKEPVLDQWVLLSVKGVMNVIQP